MSAASSISSHDLAHRLLAHRNNDVVVEHLHRTPVVGMGYCPGGDQIVLDLDPDDRYLRWWLDSSGGRSS